MIPLTPGAFMRKNRDMVDALVGQVNAQQKANRILIERLLPPGSHYSVRAFRTDDILKAVDEVGPQALLVPLSTLERQRNDLLMLIGCFVTDDGDTPWVEA